MLNLFQHLSFQHPLFQCINLEIPKQVRNGRESCPIFIASPNLSGARQSQRPTTTPRIASSLALLAMTVAKGVQRDFPLAGVWGCPPAILLPPLLEERGTGGEVNGNSGATQAIATRDPTVIASPSLFVIANPALSGRGSLLVICPPNHHPQDCFVANASRNDR